MGGAVVAAEAGGESLIIYRQEEEEDGQIMAIQKPLVHEQPPDRGRDAAAAAVAASIGATGAKTTAGLLLRIPCY